MAVAYGLHSISARPAQLLIYDALGRLVADHTQEVVKHSNGGFSEFTFDVTSLPNGLYNVVLSADGFSRTKKLLVVR